MTRIFILTVICIMAFSYCNLNAQNDRNEKTSVTLFRLPLEPLPKDYATYETRVITLDSRKSDVLNNLRISGLSLNNDGGADVILEYNETPLKLYNVDFKTAQHEETNKGVKKTVTTYYANIQYQHGISFSATDKSGKKLWGRTFYDNGYREYKSQEYSSYVEVKKNYEADAYGVEKKEFDIAMNDISNILSSNYGYSKYRMQILICSVKPKKYNYDNFNKATAMALVAINQLDSLNKLVNDLKGTDFSVYPEQYNPVLQMFRDAITLWQGELKESNLTDKKARIDEDLTYDLNINITVAYIMLRDFVNARKYLKDALAIKGTWASIYDRDLKDLTARFHANYPDKF